jgi:sulfhydrogenase subunit beta (sulfur reductase)
MTQKTVERLLKSLLSGYSVYSPIRHGDKVFVSKISEPSQVDYSSDIPFNTFKSIFLPPQEVLMNIKDGKVKTNTSTPESSVAWGMNILDLRALTLFEQVFAKDVYYQNRRRKTLIVGFSNGIESDLRKYKVFQKNYEEDVLEHLVFDIFIQRQKGGNLLFFTGSEKGQLILEKNKIKDYENIEFAGIIPEQGIDPVIEQNRKAVELGEDNPIWEELASICLACGKCTVHCPTCFCFDQKDEANSDGVTKIRQWTSCYYPEFSKVAGGHKDLDTVKKKLYYWYYHKFVRIPEEFSYYGCVSCMRCYKVCPVAINIQKVLSELNNQK